MRGKSCSVEAIAARIATRAHGIVTREELRAEDVSGRKIDLRIANGLLIPEYPGVYRVGHRARSRESDYMAAVKAAGAESALICRAAGHLLGLLKSPSWPPPEVMSTSGRNPKGLRPKRVSVLRDVTEVNGIPVTTVPRTLVDLAAVLGDEELARACHLAHVIYRVGPGQVEIVLKRHPRAKGAARLKAILTGDTKTLLSYLEKGFIIVLEKAGLPLPETNRYADGHYVDCRWPGKLTVELVSFQFHNSRWSWDEDQEREREAYARGEQFRRSRYKDVFEKPERMLAELRGLLA